MGSWASTGVKITHGKYHDWHHIQGCVGAQPSLQGPGCLLRREDVIFSLNDLEANLPSRPSAFSTSPLTWCLLLLSIAICLPHASHCYIYFLDCCLSLLLEQ